MGGKWQQRCTLDQHLRPARAAASAWWPRLLQLHAPPPSPCCGSFGEGKPLAVPRPPGKLLAKKMHPARRYLPRRCRVEEFVTRPQLAHSSGADPWPLRSHIPSPAGSVGAHPAAPVLPPPRLHPVGFLVACGCRGLFLAHLIWGRRKGASRHCLQHRAASSTVTGRTRGPGSHFQLLCGCSSCSLTWPPALQSGQLEHAAPREKQGGSLGTQGCKHSLACPGSCCLLRGGTVALVSVFM